MNDGKKTPYPLLALAEEVLRLPPRELPMSFFTADAEPIRTLAAYARESLPVLEMLTEMPVSYDTDRGLACSFCGEMINFGEGVHLKSCLWLRARELLNRYRETTG